jgi:hypothetical protein
MTLESQHAERRRRASPWALRICLMVFTSEKVPHIFQVTSRALTLATVDKIKKSLIHKAKLKKDYAKLKSREDTSAAPLKSVYEREAETGTSAPVEPVPEPSLEPHPDRVKMLKEKAPEPRPESTFERRPRRQRPQPFQKEADIAQKKKEEAEARRKAREDADKERAARLAEKERHKKIMEKARGGPGGKRKLGLESTVLLARVQKLMGKT